MSAHFPLPIFLDKKQLASLLCVSEKQIQRQSYFPEEDDKLGRLKAGKAPYFQRIRVTRTRYVFYAGDVIQALDLPRGESILADPLAGSTVTKTDLRVVRQLATQALSQGVRKNGKPARGGQIRLPLEEQA